MGRVHSHCLQVSLSTIHPVQLHLYMDKLFCSAIQYQISGGNDLPTSSSDSEEELRECAGNGCSYIGIVGVSTIVLTSIPESSGSAFLEKNHTFFLYRVLQVVINHRYYKTHINCQCNLSLILRDSQDLFKLCLNDVRTSKENGTHFRRGYSSKENAQPSRIVRGRIFKSRTSREMTIGVSPTPHLLSCNTRG